MSVGLFTDKKYQPTEAEVDQAIGARRSLWQELIDYVRETYPTQEDFKFMYGKNYGWARRFQIKGQLLTSLYPTRGGFKAQINLSPQAVETAQCMNLGANVQQAIANANPYPEGRWLFVSVDSTSDLHDIQVLLVLRVKAKRLLKDQ